MRAAGALVLLVCAGAAAEPHKTDRLAESLMAEGDRFLQQKDTTSAIALFESARVLAADRPGPHLMLGLAYAQADNCEKALPHLEKYLSLKKTDPRREATTAVAACSISEKARQQQKADLERGSAEAEQKRRASTERALQMLTDEQERNRQLEARLRDAESRPSTTPVSLLNHPMVVRNIGHRVFIEWAITVWVTPEGKIAVRDFSFRQDNHGYLIESGAVFDAGMGVATFMRVEQPGGTRAHDWYFTSMSPQLNQRW